MTKRLKRTLLAVGIVFALLGGAVVVLPPLLWGDHTDYSQVVSIERAHEYQDSALLERAFSLPVASTYKKAGVDFQGNPSFCGPTSLVNLLHSLGRPADQAHVLEGTEVSTTFGMVLGGLTLDQLAAAVRNKTALRVTVLRDLTPETFAQHVAHFNDPTRRYLVNFARGPLFGRGGGHHSPIGGYLQDEDLVLVIDVNAKYKPWLVKSQRLYDAINTVDRQSGKKRGLLLIETAGP